MMVVIDGRDQERLTKFQQRSVLPRLEHNSTGVVRTTTSWGAETKVAVMYFRS